MRILKIFDFAKPVELDSPFNPHEALARLVAETISSTDFSRRLNPFAKELLIGELHNGGGRLRPSMSGPVLPSARDLSFKIESTASGAKLVGELHLWWVLKWSVLLNICGGLVVPVVALVYSPDRSWLIRDWHILLVPVFGVALTWVLCVVYILAGWREEKRLLTIVTAILEGQLIPLSQLTSKRASRISPIRLPDAIKTPSPTTPANPEV